MIKKIRKVHLKTGERLDIVLLKPPAGDYFSFIDRSWKRSKHICDRFATSILKGKLTDHIDATFLFGEINGKIAGFMAYLTPVDIKNIGNLAFVETLKDYRKKGIASALLGETMRIFKDNGGDVIHLATDNPIANSFYKKFGFFDLGTYEIMRYTSSGENDFEKNYFHCSNDILARNTNWGDLPHIQFLFSTTEHPWLVYDYLRGIWKKDRKTAYEQDFLEVMDITEDKKGTAIVLENNLKRVTGYSSLVINKTFTGIRSADFDFFIRGEYFDKIPILLQAIEERAKNMQIEELEIWICKEDREKIDAIKKFGFNKIGERIDIRFNRSLKIPMDLYSINL